MIQIEICWGDLKKEKQHEILNKVGEVDAFHPLAIIDFEVEEENENG